MKTIDVGPENGRTLFSPTGFDRAFARGVRRSLLLARLTTPVRVPATIRLPEDRPVIVAANHSSMFDLAASLITVGNYGAAARMGVHARFFKRAGVGRFLHRIGCIPFSSELADEAERTMIGALEDGQLCCLMPEGRIVRSDQRVDGRVGQGRPGISRIARATGAAILPVGFAGADRAWRPGTAVPRLRRRDEVVANIGEPFMFDGDDHTANADLVMATISDLLARHAAAAGV
ncbi:MAG: lysophospholipid acyltransferase family protein [Actinomycetota bacterium]